MLKKMVILGVIGFVAVSAISGTKIASYIRSEVRSARLEAEENIPPEKEIARLKNEVSLLDKDVKTLVNHLAKARVEVNQLKEKVDEMALKQSNDKELLTARLAALKTAEKDASQQVSFGGRPLSLTAARVELDQSVTRFETNGKSLATHESLLANRIKQRDTLEKQLEAIKNQKSELAAQVDSLEAELQVLKLQQMESKYQTDDTRMSRIKEDMAKLKTRVAVEREKLNLMPVVNEDRAPTTGKSTEDIEARLNGPAKKPEGAKKVQNPNIIGD